MADTVTSQIIANGPRYHTVHLGHQGFPRAVRNAGKVDLSLIHI